MNLNPTIYGITPFLVERALEQIKLDFLYQKQHGNIITTGASYDFSKGGYSHFCPEDMQVLKSLPDIEIVTPGSGKEFSKLFSQTHNDDKLTYFRLSDFPNKKSMDVSIGQATVVKRGTRATIVAVGTILDEVIQACLDEDINIIYYSSIAPFDYSTLRNLETAGRVLICEPFYEGTLLYDVSKALSGKEIQIDMVGIPRTIIRDYRTKAEKDQKYNLNSTYIKYKLKRLIGEV